MFRQNISCIYIVFRYLSNHLANLFAGAWEERDVDPLPVHRPMPTVSEGNGINSIRNVSVHVIRSIQIVNILKNRLDIFTVQLSAEIVSRAKKPVIVLGSQATLPPVPADQLRKTLEVIASLVDSY